MNQDMADALKVIESMISRGEKAQRKFAEGTAPHTLQKNRLHALHIASLLIKSELAGTMIDGCTKEDLEKACAPIASLVSKSEKVLQKLAPGTWQYSMTENNLKALYIASPLLQKALLSLS